MFEIESRPENGLARYALNNPVILEVNNPTVMTDDPNN